MNGCTLALAACCGFLGGVALTRIPTVTAASTALRISRLELTDPSGKVRAVLGFDSRREPSLRFLTTAGAEIASVGLSSDLPEIRFGAPDEPPRLAMNLSRSMRPLISMGDTTKPTRILLGASEGDTASDVANWGLEFLGPGPIHTWAGIGLIMGRHGEVLRGSITAKDSDGHFFSAPEK